tara:strand:- start:138 stop:311 length:174 start_codon:yes stop_codon:yes gene_type:complete
MENIIDLIATDSAPTDISKNIHDLLYQKATAKIENMRSTVASQMFDSTEEETSEDQE